ncbi:EF-hand domain-containing protein [Candidatus Methylobacter oryzae]|uniref:EF-hand domain-containing protein n=1 Tax=Candidatus Methylobacter oryzae TaxID=2497749 RepID=UPI001F4FD118|nr:EF-hand domain-containing protein [Candidatus Methylobacter oryzae]
MKIKKIIYEIPGAMSISELDPASLHSLKIFSLPIWLIAISICLSFTAKPVRAGTEDMHQYFRYIPYEGPKSTTGTDGQRPKQAPGANETEAKKAQTGEQASGTGQKTEGANQATEVSGQKSPVNKPERDTGEFPSGKIPSFSQVDINGDHYVTKDELKNFPELLRVFDKVDAGKDGRLEQHEFQNLEMETEREGEIP